LTNITLTALDERYESGPNAAVRAARHGFHCAFDAIPSAQQYRPKRATPKPHMQGPQTALVVGDGEIHTDKYGRIKVQFYWDRYGKRNDGSSCWIRVSQNWGGKGWGGMFIPHVGQEVIVEFLEGDPDQPLVTGRVYNAENMPPVALPAGKTVSVISDHGGNSIKMEGNGGSQQIKMHSPTGNTTFALGAPNSPGNGLEGITDLEIKWHSGLDWKEKVLKNKTIEIKLDYDEKVEGNRRKLVLGYAEELIWGRKETIIEGYKMETIKGYESKNVAGFTWTKIGGFSTSLIGGFKSEIVAGSDTKINLVNKNDVICGRNAKLTKGTLVDINNAKVLSKRPTFMNNVQAVIEKIDKEEKEANSVKENIKNVMQQKITELEQSIGKLSAKVDGAYKLTTRGKLTMTANGGFELVASLATFSKDMKLHGDLEILGSSITMGSVFKAKG
jgi:type VI secretion system secreted protein VgrG